MNESRLKIYLNDHLALLVGELELARRCHRENQHGSLAEFLEGLTADLSNQQAVLRDVLKRVGGTESSLKQGAAWAAEKLGRLKLNDSLVSYSELSRLLELEGLALVALERVFLWETLDTAISSDPRLEGFSFPYLRDQAQHHLDELMSRRRFAAQQALGGQP